MRHAACAAAAAVSSAGAAARDEAAAGARDEARTAARGGAGIGGSAILAGMRNQKVDPLPGSLSIPMEPPMSVTRRWLIARPRPIPPYRLVVAESAWLNARNSLAAASVSTPIPESITRK